MTPFYGKYRGTVIDNIDPLNQGRLQVAAPQVLGAVVTSWAMPCVPYAGQNVGFCMVPPIDAAVWVEFEGGDLDYPIWTGCYWREGERPIAAMAPENTLIRTQSASLMFDDTPGIGGFALTVEAPAVAVPVSVKASSDDGLRIMVGGVGIVVGVDGVAISADPAKVTITSGGVFVAHHAVTVDIADPAIAVVGDVLVNELASTDVAPTD